MTIFDRRPIRTEDLTTTVHRVHHKDNKSFLTQTPRNCASLPHTSHGRNHNTTDTGMTTHEPRNRKTSITISPGDMKR